MMKSYETQIQQLFDYLVAIAPSEKRERFFFNDFFETEDEDAEDLGIELQSWSNAAPELYMKAQGLSENECKVVRVLLLQALLEEMPVKPFCGRLSQLLPLVASEGDIRKQLDVIKMFIPGSRLRQNAVVQVKGAILGSDPKVQLTPKALTGMLGELVFPLLGLEPFAEPIQEVSKEERMSGGLLIKCSLDRAPFVASTLAVLCGGMAWKAPKELDVDALPHELLKTAFAHHGGLLVLEEDGDYMSNTLHKLARQFPVIQLVDAKNVLRIQVLDSSKETGTQLKSRLRQLLSRSSGDGQATKLPELQIQREA